MRVATLTALLAVAVGLLGCGGSGSDTPTTPAKVTTSIALQWPAVSRALNAPASAQSVTLTVSDPVSGKTEAVGDIDRDAKITQHIVYIPLLQQLVPDSYALSATFWSGPSGAGSQVATAKAFIKVTSDGTVLRSDGTALSVTAGSNVASVSVATTSVPFGKSADPVVTCLDAQSKVLAVNPGAIQLTVATGPATVQSGHLVGTDYGEGTLTASVDGVTSPPANYNVVLPLRPLLFTTNRLSSNPATGAIYATVPGNSTQYPNCLIEIDPVTGSVKRSVVVGSEPNAIGISTDGTIAYVGLDGIRQIVQVKLSDFSVGSKFPIQPIPQYLLTAYDIEVCPNVNDTIAINAGPVFGGAGLSSPQIYKNGTLLSNLGISAFTTNITWASSSDLYASTAALIADHYAVDAKGVTLAPNGVSSFSMGDNAHVFGGRLYGNSGNIFDPKKQDTVGKFSGLNQYSSDLTVDSNISRAYSVTSTLLNVYDTSTYALIKSVPMQFPASIERFDPTLGVFKYGKDGIVFSIAGQIFFADSVPQ